MNCQELRDLFYMDDEAAIRAHAEGCPDCRAWLLIEERLAETFAAFRAEAGHKTAGIRLRPPAAPAYHERRRPLSVFVAVAAALVLAVGVYVLSPGKSGPEIAPTRVVLIEGRVKDADSPPLFVEVDGRRFPVRRISADEGVWQAQLEVPLDKREFLLCATDAAGNRRLKLLRLIE